jgi:hypothetical protein
MDVDEARDRAVRKLREMESAETPLQLDETRGPQERAWCWIFPFDSVRYFQTCRFMDSVVSGPIVVNKDGSDTWIAGTALPLDEWLDNYAEKNGYPRVSAD